MIGGIPLNLIDGVKITNSEWSVVEGDEMMRQEKFTGWGPMLLLGQDITEKTLGIIGAGRIGENVARKMARGFGMKILYTDLKSNPTLEKETGARKVDMETLCRESDYISIHVNYHPGTHHLINEKNLNLMKKNAILVNTSRGPVVDETALVETLKAKKIFGAGLDVFEDEPKMKPGLKDLRNVILAPHVGSATIGTRTNMGLIAVQNIMDALSGKEPKYLANKDFLNAR